MNDAYLVAAGTRLRFILEDRGESILKTIAVPVPVSVTAIGDARNAVGFMIIDLPFQQTSNVPSQSSRSKLRPQAVSTCGRNNLSAHARGRARLALAAWPVGGQSPRRLHGGVLQRQLLDRNPDRCRASPSSRRNRPHRRANHR
ncbi:hypothetical protein BKP30_26175 [Rhodococcus erythropolis]|nr:hypothetical protein BKP30_26175 [Rhodococcus erythropolis]